MVLVNSLSTNENMLVRYYECCENPKIIEHQGVFVCQSCAVVHEPSLRVSSKTFPASDSAHTEVDRPHPLQSYGGRTGFSYKTLSPKKKLLFSRMAKLNNQFNTPIEGNFQKANQKFHIIASQLEIPPQIYQRAFRLYVRGVNARLTAGRSIENLVVASLFITCNQNQRPLTLKAFSNLTGVPEKNLRKYCRLLINHFNLKIRRYPTSFYLIKFCTELELATEFITSARIILEILKRTNSQINSSPRRLAAAIIYYSAKRLTVKKAIKQKTLTELAQVSEVTLRKYVKVVSEHVNLHEKEVEHSPSAIKKEALGGITC